MKNLILNLKAISMDAETLAVEICQTFKGDMHNENLLMCKHFSERQASHIKSLNLLADQDDVILIARSMFEGALYLFHSIRNNTCKNWLLFSVILDKQTMDRAEQMGTPIPDEEKDFIKKMLPEAETIFKIPKKSGYYKTWLCGKTIKDIATNVGDSFSGFYTSHYEPMSDFHHWGTASFGKRYKIYEKSITKIESPQAQRELAGSICMALSSLLSTLEISCKIFETNIPTKLEDLKLRLKKLPNLSTHQIEIRPQKN